MEKLKNPQNMDRTLSILILFVSNILLTWIFVKTPAWKVIEFVSRGLEWIILQSSHGIEFVFGGLVDKAGYIFILSALLPIVFLASLIGALVHLGVIPFFIKYLGMLFSKIFRIDRTVAINSICNMFLGQTESLFITKTSLKRANNNVIFATMVGGMSSISVSVAGLYTTYGAQMEYIVLSMVLTSVSSLLFCQIFKPTYDESVTEVEVDKGVNILDTMFKYAYEGFKTVGYIAVALMMFISLLKVLEYFIPITSIISSIFYPILCIFGVGGEEGYQIANLLSQRLLANEVVAFSSSYFATLSESTKAMTTVMLCGFGGIGSIGIMLGGYAVIAPNKVKVVAKYGIYALLVSTICNIFSGLLLRLFL